MSDRISRKELATEWGVSTQAVDRFVKDGRLKVGKDKLLSRSEAAKLRAGLSPSHVEKEAIAKEIGGQGNAQQNPAHPLVQARTMEAVYRAKSRELDFKKATGELVPIADIKTEAFEIGRALQQRLLAFPARLSAELATLAALPAEKIEMAIREVLHREVRAVVSDLIVGIDQLQSSKTATGTS